jgi:PTH1 family peptidyl-tRNA hydrolase
LKLVVGVGNPGKRYDGTRHNVGFEVLDRLKIILKAGEWRDESKFRAAVAESADVRLVKPETFVNLTGDAAGAMVRWFKGEARDCLVVCDDVNLDFGKLRLRESGSAGGHHGLESVIAALGTEAFPRLRFGVRTPEMPRDLTGFVLGGFSAEEKKGLGKLVDRAAAVCESWATDGFAAAQNRLSQMQSVK